MGSGWRTNYKIDFRDQINQLLKIINVELEKGPPVKKIVLDFGGVLFDGSDNDLFATLGKKLNRDPKVIGNFIEDSDNGGWTGIDKNGKRVSEIDYGKNLFKLLNLPYPGIEGVRDLFASGGALKPINTTKKLVRALSKKSNVELWVYSDAVLPGPARNRQLQAQFFPELAQDKTIVSSEIGFSKRDREMSAFAELLKRMDNPDPLSVLYIDDIEKYTVVARAKYNLKAITYPETQRIREALAGQLIQTFSY